MNGIFGLDLIVIYIICLAAFLMVEVVRYLQ